MHTNHTSNYELSQFVGTDKPTFLGDYNGDMLKIDTAIAGVDAKAIGADSKADTAITAANTASDTASGAATLANTANTNANSALATAGNAATAASAAQSSADAAGTAASAADTKATAANTAIGDLTQLTTTAKTDLVAAINEVNAKPTGGGTAAATSYDNTTSGLTADNVQAAIDELKALIPTTPEYVTTGLSVYQNRCVINDGGYYIDDNDMVHVDITVTASASQSANAALVIGFPQSTATASGAFTPVFNNGAMAYDPSEGRTFLWADSAISAGGSIHFIGSYQLKTT